MYDYVMNAVEITTCSLTGPQPILVQEQYEYKITECVHFHHHSSFLRLLFCLTMIIRLKEYISMVPTRSCTLSAIMSIHSHTLTANILRTLRAYLLDGSSWWNCTPLSVKMDGMPELIVSAYCVRIDRKEWGALGWKMIDSDKDLKRSEILYCVMLLYDKNFKGSHYSACQYGFGPSTVHSYVCTYKGTKRGYATR